MLLKRLSVIAACIAVLGLLSACAESVATPDTVTGLSSSAKASLKLGAITDEPAPGVAMTPMDLQRILEQVKADITAAHPAIWAPANVAADAKGAPLIANVKIVFTQYDGGSAFGRFMLAGIGQIHIDGDVIFSDAASGKQIAEYKVSKDFAFGGLYGATTRIEDVEKGFAKSVAVILDTQQASIVAGMQGG